MSPEGGTLEPTAGNLEVPLTQSLHSERETLSNEIGADFAPKDSRENRQSVKFKIESQTLRLNPSEKGSWKASEPSTDGEFRTYP